MRQTSKDAYDKIKPDLPTKQLQVWNALSRNTMTGGELNEYLETHSAHKRLSELQRKGVIFEQRTRKCKISGANCIEWGTAKPSPQATLF